MPARFDEDDAGLTLMFAAYRFGIFLMGLGWFLRGVRVIGEAHVELPDA